MSFESMRTFVSGMRSVISPLGLICCTTALLVCLPSGSAYCWQEEYQFVMEWGSTGSDTGQFNTPVGMGIDRNCQIYVCEMGNNRVQRFDTLGNFNMMFGSTGTGQGQFLCARDVAVDDSGYIYVSDPCNSRIQKFDSLGNFVLAWGDTGSAPGEFQWCQGVDVDNVGRIYVAETSNHRIQRFDDTGAFIDQWFFAPDSGSFAAMGIVVSDDEVYSYNGNSPGNVICFDTSGQYLLEWGGWGLAPDQFRFVSDLAIDTAGNVYGTDGWNRRVQKFDSNGKLMTLWGSSGDQPGQLLDPYGIVVDNNAAVYVGDASRNRILKFVKID
jgi:tripartite motif-containing protein 71